MMKKLLLFSFLFTIGVNISKAQTADVSKYVMYFPFDDNLTDASSTGVALTPKTAAVVDTYVDGKFGKAALFNEKPYITQNSIFQSGASYTMMMWIKFNTITFAGTGTPKIIHQEDDGPTTTNLAGRPLQIATAQNTINTSFGETASNSTNSPAVDTWVHIALVMDKTAGKVILYVDGVENSNKDVGAGILDDKLNSGQLNIGVQKSSATHTDASIGLLDAYIDDFVITTEVLDPTTINNVMTNGASSGGVLSADDFTSKTMDVKLFKSNENRLELKSSVNFDGFIIVNTLGQEIKSGRIENNTINVNSISKGLHFVKLYSSKENIEISKKIVF